MTDLDQQIRDRLDRVDSAPYATAGSAMLTTTLRKLLDLRWHGGAPGESSAWLQAGYQQALIDMRVEIADALGAEGADWSPERHSGAALGAVAKHVEGQVHEHFTVEVLGTDQHGNFRTQP